MTRQSDVAMLSAVSFTSRKLRDEPARRAFPWRTVLLRAMKVGAPLARLWMAYWAKKKAEQERKYRLRAMFKRMGMIIGVAVLLLLVGVAGVKALVATKLLNIRSVAEFAGTPLPQDEHGHLNLLLLGQGDESHDGVDLTDTMIIASIDPDDGSMVMLSIPRDLYFLRTQRMGVGRVNSLYRDYKGYLMAREDKTEEEASLLGMRELADELGRTLQMDIHHVIKVDFIGFVKAVDAIGGVQLDVPYDIVDPEYPGPNYTYQTFTIRAGPQLLDGETALKYARSRHTTNDFSRSARQQQILKEMGRKVRDEGLFSHPSRILNLLSIMQDHVMTTLSTRELVSLGELGSDIDQSKMLSMQLNTENGLYSAIAQPGGFLYYPPREDFGGASVILPVSIPASPISWKQLQCLTRLLIHIRDPYLDHPTFAVLNAGAPSGSSRALGNELIRYGFEVATMENAPDDLEVEASYVEADAQQKEGASFIANLLGMDLRLLPEQTSSVPSGTPPPAARPITIVQGKDYQYLPFQTFLAPQVSSSASPASSDSSASPASSR